MRRILMAFLVGVLPVASMAQSGTNSPYSQYGLGVLSEQTGGYNRGMNGLGYGLRESNRVNTLNPASYSSIDSLTFIFDVGMSLQTSNFKENTAQGSRSVNAKNADFEYVVAGFRLCKNVGISIGVLPYTNVGYSYTNHAPEYVDAAHTTTISRVFQGSGGFHQAYAGVGAELFPGFSLGMNFAYLWGSYSKSAVHTLSESSANSLAKYYEASVRNYKVDFGAQYSQRISTTDVVTVGLTYSPGHNIGGNPRCLIVSSNSETSLADTALLPLHAKKLHLQIPSIYGLGGAWKHEDKWVVGIDYQLQAWKNVKTPVDIETGGTADYVLMTGQYKNRHKVTLGGDYCPEAQGRSFFKQIHYHAGFSYTTPYLNINGKKGPKEVSATVGLAIPLLTSSIMNSISNRSVLNISAQWIRQSASAGLITDNTFRINLGLTFNERWFAKWKVQ